MIYGLVTFFKLYTAGYANLRSLKRTYSFDLLTIVNFNIHL